MGTFIDVIATVNYKGQHSMEQRNVGQLKALMFFLKINNK